jgi:hypothetical protein
MKKEKQIQDIIDKLNSGVVFQNDVADYQFIQKKDGLMLLFSNGHYTFFTDQIKFAKKILKAMNGQM